MSYEFKIKLLQAIEDKVKVESLLFAYNLIDDNLVNMRKLILMLGFDSNNVLSKINGYASKMDVDKSSFVRKKVDGKLLIYLDFDLAYKVIWYYASINLVFGKGIQPLNHPTKCLPEDKQVHAVWVGLVERCYSEYWHHKNNEDADLKMSKKWLLFDNFKKWYKLHKKDDCEIRWDIYDVSNRFVSEKHAVFIPSDLSLLLDDFTRDRYKRPIGVDFKITRKDGPFEAFYFYRGETVHVGYYMSYDEAFDAYKEAKVTRIRQLSTEYHDKGMIDSHTLACLCAKPVGDNINEKVFPKERTELLVTVRKGKSLDAYFEKHNLFDREGFVDLREVLSVLGLSKGNYSGKMKFYANKLNIKKEDIKIRQSGTSKDFIFNDADMKTIITTIVQEQLAYNHGINDYMGRVVFDRGILPSYRKWCGMLERCYSEKWHQKKPTYKECFVSDDWLLFSNFKKWFDENNIEGFVLDKDILFKSNKEYSAETCVFIPEYINSLFIKKNASRGKHPIGVTETSRGSNRFRASVSHNRKNVELGIFDTPEEAFFAYKKGKEAYIKEVAEDYLDKGLISRDVYEALLRYKVDIND